MADSTVSHCLLELHLLPCLEYMSLFYRYSSVIIEQHEHYQKGGYRNRAVVAGPNGPLILSVPLRKGKHQQMPIRSVEIAYDEPWQSNHWHSLQSAYGRSPFFTVYAEELESLIRAQEIYLFDYSENLLLWIIDVLGLNRDILALSERFVRKPDCRDLRGKISPKDASKGTISTKISYEQVFSDRLRFLPNLSILDLLFCTGPEAGLILERSIKN